MKRVQSKDQLRSIMGTPSPTTPMKFHSSLNAKATEFIQKSPLLFLSTADASGRPTVSPKGDPPGFIRIENPTTLLIPERKGNRLLASLQNIVENDQIGLIFLVPRTVETLRVHGKCSLIVDDELCHSFTIRGQAAILVMRVEVTECYFHCGKALLRSDLWNPTSWPVGVSVSFGAEIAENLKPDNCKEFIAGFDSVVQEQYRTNL